MPLFFFRALGELDGSIAAQEIRQAPLYIETVLSSNSPSSGSRKQITSAGLLRSADLIAFAVHVEPDVTAFSSRGNVNVDCTIKALPITCEVEVESEYRRAFIKCKRLRRMQTVAANRCGNKSVESDRVVVAVAPDLDEVLVYLDK